MRALRRHNPLAYRQPRWHLVDGEGTVAICGTDVAAVKGDRRGAVGKSSLKQTDGQALLKESPYSLCQRCRTKAAGGGGSAKLNIPAMKALIAQASEAASRAFAGATPTPMIVGTPKDLMGSLTGGDGGGFDPDQPIYRVNEGVCGMGWVRVRPGNSRFARFLVKEGIASPDSYAGGVTIFGSSMGVPLSQSMARNEAAARAYAEVLREAGIEASGESRID